MHDLVLSFSLLDTPKVNKFNKFSLRISEEWIQTWTQKEVAHAAHILLLTLIRVMSSPSKTTISLTNSWVLCYHFWGVVVCVLQSQLGGVGGPLPKTQTFLYPIYNLAKSLLPYIRPDP